MSSPTNSNFNPFVWMRCPPTEDAEEFTYNYVCKYNGKIFDILLAPKSLPGSNATDSIENQLLQRLEAVSSCDGDDDDVVAKMLDESDKVSAEIETPVLKASQALMEALAPDTEDISQIKPLRSWMYPEIIYLQLFTEDKNLKAIKRDDLPTRDFHPPITDPQILDISIPHHQVSNIQVIAELYPYVYKVLVNGQTMCAKVTRNSVHDSVSDEIKKLYHIQTTSFDTPVRVPQLKGLIISHTGVVGFLIDYITSLGYNLQDALRCAKITSRALIVEGDGPPPPAIIISKAQKEKWSSQVEETLQALHTRDIIWGDAKMANILIDEVTDNAWVVDFGGGNTEGWIDRELHGSKAGDRQALECIKKELADD